ncbi:uncharacterized protein LOC124997963 [Mugil cephalus]|uniref:uncharacterized protein LOC124997963 n=1 Tax=Mugil cephalus TaxID=48193 RepID=UPI001FB60D00|nr:uncharacterized protein LOC124997963 [Mugil cephalus]XP_047428007.1 uncharacterized protein LOC124997963 [Mugil cephalus]
MINMKKRKQRHSKPTKNKNKHVSVDRNRQEFANILDTMMLWFSDHQQQIDQLFGHGDTDRSGSVNLKDFELGLMNLGVPCQQSHLHTLTQLLKTSNNTVTYQDLGRQVQTLSTSTEVHTQILEDPMERQGAVQTESSTCLGSQQRQLHNENYSRFVCLSVRLIHFDLAAAHPGNFEVVLSSSSRVCSLISEIQGRAGIQTSRLEVFRSRVPTEDARLSPESSLEECGFQGGPEQSPPEATVYYDYSLLFTDCPVLNCDHYFRLKPDSAARRNEHCL